ncbi:MAG: LmbE-like protein [Acidobacteriaceae bacterium]|nr:LmbE-like protein [Acidobacteriaceae bacterium]
MLVIVAHPDDEAVGCGILLQRMKSPSVAFMTNGAPVNRYFWDAYKSRQNYATVRRRESQRALAQLGYVTVGRFDAPDQELFRNLEEAREWLALMVEQDRPDAILTHAYEGGHPDHDACSFLGSVIGRTFDIPVWEMPLYRLMNERLVRQRFLDSDDNVTIVATQNERDRKQKMISSYRSQLEFLTEFQTVAEDYRPQPEHDFLQPPHEGILNYESWGWGISGRDLCREFGEALKSIAGERVGKTA